MSKKPKNSAGDNQKSFDFDSSRETNNSRAKVFQFKVNEKRGALSVSSDFLDRVLARADRVNFDQK